MLMDPQKVYIRYKEYIKEPHAKDENNTVYQKKK